MGENFRYTLDNGSFTNEQRRFYEDNGYIIIKNLVFHKNLDQCQEHFVDICNGKANPGTMLVMKDGNLRKRADIKGEYVINKIQDWLYDDVFFKNYASNPKIIEIAKNFVGPNVTCMNSLIVNKPPDNKESFSRHPMHQDLHYFPFRPPDRIVAAWTAIEYCDENNGCLFAIPGSHKIGKLYSHDYPKDVENKAFHGAQGYEELPCVNLKMDKGDSVFFHPLLLHGSGPNKSKGFRKAICVHYADTNCNFIDVHGTSQENIAREVIDMARKKFGLNISFIDIWKIKSRLITGPVGAFQTFGSHL